MSREVPNEAFRTKVRSLISLIDRLRNLDLDQDVNLPAVAVIGDQSAGKSSVLEAISGVQLPRGTGIVTRCPLEMRMYQVDTAWQGRISYITKDGHKVVYDIQSCENVGKMVRQAQTQMTGDDTSISDSLITLEVASPDVPNLTLIDLPGIARVVAHGQQSDLEERIKTLIRTYIERQSTIILAVVQCNVDIATCEAIKMATYFDKGGCRTLGVLTKPDLVDPGAEQEVMQIMENTKYPLTKGYFVVKCRGQNAVNKRQSLKDALTDEANFFKSHDQFKRVPLSRRGIEKLSVQLSNELKDHIQVLLPQLRGNVRDQLYETTGKLTELGMCPSDMTQKRHIAHKITSYFCEVLQRIIRGEKIDKETFPKDINLFYNHARKAFQDLYKKAVENSPVKHTVITCLKQDVETGRGRELVDYAGKFEYVEKYAKQFIRKLHRPVVVCLDTVHDLQSKMCQELVVHCFGRFPNFASKVKEVIAQKKADAAKNAREEIDRCIMMEANFIYTQDVNYMTSLQEEETERMENLVSTNRTIQQQRQQIRAAVANAPTHDAEKIFRSLVSYYKVAMTRICDNVPMIIHQQLFLDEVQAICEQLNALTAGDGIVHLVSEQEDVARMRQDYTEKQIRLHKAMEQLEHFEVMGGTDALTMPGVNFL